MSARVETMPAGSTTYRGHLVHITGAPAAADVDRHLVSISDGALVVAADGTIAWSGPHDQLPAEHDGSVVDHRGRFLLPGFVDTHLHFPQTYAVDAHGGGQLLEWLERCIFPAEARLSDPEHATRVAEAFVRRRLAAGTTAALVFGSAFPPAQDALFAAHAEAGLRLISGRCIQTVGPEAAQPLLTSEADALRLTQDEIDRWHGQDLLQVALTPRFGLSVTPETLAGLGELHDAVRGSGVYVQTHLNENDRPGDGEIAQIRRTYDVQHYLDVYDGRFLPGSARGGPSLLGRRTVMAHAVHTHDDELARMAATGTSIAHCPTSQLFLGSGTMPWERTLASGVTVAIGTDIGAGDEWLVPRVLNDCYKVHLSEPGGVALSPADLLFAGTLAGARALDQEERFGNLDAGKDADFVVIDPDRWEPLAMQLNGLPDDEEPDAPQLLFRLLMALREPAISSVHVRGRELKG